MLKMLQRYTDYYHAVLLGAYIQADNKVLSKGSFSDFCKEKTAQIVFLMLHDLTVSCLAHGTISPTGASSHFLKAFPPAFLEIKLKYHLF